jgi:processive 1,2-diacylglycerol beta-glucosyltransferase
MPRLYFPDSGETIGEISDEQLQFLIDQLEEESLDDQDYYINQETIEMFRERGCDEELLGLLQNAIGDKEDIDIAWE